ncbi:MAG: hypothetical protein II718_01925 [Clostridiales bacterium]|nr:hypothetical protein [Clostridiales bacterium]
MLSYDEFKTEVTARFMDFMGSDYKDHELEVMPVKKRGRQLDGFSIAKAGEGRKATVRPTLYFNDLYDGYLKTGNIEREMRRAAMAMKNGISYGKTLTGKLDYKNAGDSIIFQLVPRDGNDSLLNDVPHRDFLDLAIIYRWAVSIERAGISSTIIDNDLATVMGYSEDELFDHAYENTLRLLPPCVKDMDDVVEEMMVNRGVPDAEIENYRSHDSDDEKMYILSNSISHFGANLILYDDILHDIAFGMDSDLYLMMPSIDEILIIKAAPQVDPEVLAGFLCDIHSDEEDEAKKLSDCVYLYSLSTRKIFPMVSQSRCV